MQHTMGKQEMHTMFLQRNLMERCFIANKNCI